VGASESDTMDGWQVHSMKYIEMAYNTDRRKRIDKPDGYGKRTGVCGDTIEIFLMIKDDFIHEVYYDTDGCINTNACCNALIHFIENRDIYRAWKITPEKIIQYLQTLPPENHHCAELAAGSLYLALSDYEKKKKTTH
jgi:nitrogen fixation NifU-like protein